LEVGDPGTKVLDVERRIELLFPRPGSMVRSDGVDAAVRERLPQGLHVARLPERGLAHEERSIGAGESLFGEVEVERAGLDGDRKSSPSSSRGDVEGGFRGKVDDVDGSPGHFRDTDGALDGA
jgi:hypothetical protein